MAIVTPPPSPHPDDAIAVPDDPAAVFDAVVADNPRVCQRCFRRLRRRVPFPQEAGEDYGAHLSFVDVEIPDDTMDWEVADREYYEDVTLPGRRPRANPPTDEPHRSARYCWQCGTFATTSSPPTRSLEDAIDAAAGLSVTLDELDITHDWVALLKLVDELKRRPQAAADDHFCFREATRFAIEYHPAEDWHPQRPG